MAEEPMQVVEAEQQIPTHEQVPAQEQIPAQGQMPPQEPIPGHEQIKEGEPNESMAEGIPDMPLNGIDAISNLKRYCYLGSFEPVYIHLRRRYVDVPRFWPTVKRLVKEINDEDFVALVRGILEDVSLIRRDEVIFVYAAYLASDVEAECKKKVRISFAVLIHTDEQLFLFCKYCSLIGKEKNQKCFSQTVRKALKAWYNMQSEDVIRSMWLSHRGLHNFTHKALMKLCHLNDNVIGSSEVATPFFRTCTEIMKDAEVKIKPKEKEPEPEPEPSTSALGTVKAEQSCKEHQKQNSETPTSIIVGVSKLRTTDVKLDAIRIIRKFHLPYKYVPGHLLRHPVIMEAVLPTMTYLQILKRWRKMVHFNHFEHPKVFKACQKILGNVEFAKNNRIHPVHLLMSMHDIAKDSFRKIPLKRYNQLNLEYLDKLYKQSFDWPIESGNLRMLITVNLQKNYKGKFLKNHKKLTFYDACLALAFGYLKRESHVDVYHWVEEKTKLAKLPLTKTLTTELGFNAFEKVENKKNSQRLVNSLMYGLSSEQVYDVFLCIVPKAGRGNPKQNSQFLVSFLDKYHELKNPKARLIILNLMKFKRRSMKYSEKRSENILEICGLDEHTTDLIHNFATHRFD